MPDITMCKGDGCPMRETCYRYKAKANDCWQSWFANVPYDEESGKCDHYWLLHDIKEKKKLDNLNDF